MPASRPAPALDDGAAAEVRALLLAWYEAEGGAFPWRGALNPYWALVAGVCAQQTRMARVLPLWERWTRAFPTARDAAAASAAEALRAWGGAGYPRRALRLREACARCAAEHGGQPPRDEAALLALPGVGPFTAAIVRSLGYGEDAAAVDTNVVRLIGRLVHGDLQPARETPPAALAATARRLLPPGEAARWNPALMDFGGRVCAPRPRCGECPVAGRCAARPRFERGEAASPLRAQPPFEGSDRQLRGRILAALREAAGPLPEAALTRSLAAGGASRARVRRLLAALCAEGLAWREGGSCGLGAREEAEAAR